MALKTFQVDALELRCGATQLALGAAQVQQRTQPVQKPHPARHPYTVGADLEGVGDAPAGLLGAHLRAQHRRGGIAQALDYAAALGCPRIHVMAGLLPAGQSRDALQAVYLDNLHWAAAAAVPYGVTLLIEPINLRDMPG